MYLVYGIEGCKYCDATIELCDEKEINTLYVKLNEENEDHVVIAQKIATDHNHTTFPAILVCVEDEMKFIGGFDDFKKHLEDKLL